MNTLFAEECPGFVNSVKHSLVFNIFLKQKGLSQRFQQHKAELFIQLFLVRKHVFKKKSALNIEKPALEHSFWKTEFLQNGEPSLK